MNKTEKKGLGFAGRNRLATIIAFVVIAVVFALFLTTTKARIDEYANYTVQNQMKMASVSISAKLNDARRSVAAAAGDVSAGWKEGDFNVVALVDSIKDKYIFDVLEFVDADGINLMSGANRFDASDREYYKQGIQGNTGLWINYTPRESKEFLLDFYSPVYYKGEIVGVLVAAIGSKTSLEPLTQTQYLGREVIGILYNEDERAIAASFGVDGELYSADIYDIFNLTDDDKEIFSEHVKAKDGTPFQYEGEKGVGIACTFAIEDTDWGLVMIIPSSTFSSVYGDFTNVGIITLGIIIIVVCIYIIYTLGINRIRYTAEIKEDIDIINGFSKVYNSVFMINYSIDKARCLRLRDPVAAKFGIKEGELISLSEVFMKYLVSIAAEDDVETLSSFDNVMYLRTMMEEREYIILEFKQKTGGRGSLAIADMGGTSAGDANTENGGRYLIGITELG